MNKNLKVISLVVFGNALDYYDFMLFAYLGAIITGYFIPDLDPVQSHLLSLLLFAIPFVIRPVGGYFFGKLSDINGRGYALGQTLKYASFASLGIALLPGYEIGGLVSIVLFILLRALQGLSLGGEYTTAGTVLMEKYNTHRGLLSGIVGASGTVGSFLAFSFSWLYLNDYLSGDAWRIAFGIGSAMTYISYLLRKKLKNEMVCSVDTKAFRYNISHRKAILITLFTGILVGVTIWIPVIYANFYLTKILHYPYSAGLNATLIALVGSIVLTPFFGYLSDRYSRPEIVMTVGAVLTIPLCLLGFPLIQQGNLIGQVFLILAAVIFAAPMHAMVNALFPVEIRGRSINTTFMLGASVGSLIPVISGYCATNYNIHSLPVGFVVIFGIITSIIFYLNFFKKSRLK
ncbi:MAG: MFS transporter [Gammaproteobacteria bacterium]